MVKRLSIFNSNLFKALFNLALFFLIIWSISYALYAGINYMYFNSFGGNSGAQINHVLRTEYDVYIFGASRASHHYNPSVISNRIGMTCFNAGDDGKNATYQLGLLKMMLKNHTPKMIIYEIGDVKYSLESGTADLFPYYYKYLEIRPLIQDRDKWAKLKFLMPLYAYNRKVFAISKGFLRSDKPFKTGYRPLDGKMHPAEVKLLAGVLDSGKIARVNPIVLSNFKQFVEICRSNRICLVLSYSPTYLPSDPSGLREATEISNNYKIPLFLFGRNTRFNYNSKLFKDAGHMNREGADVFTNLFIEELMTVLGK